ncbi:MAG TPA: hypothetical protein VGO47_09750, partial [Chlamydiales bacterium]|nr:hypothetical protein [Chlamydiales bacterium]
TQKTVLDTSTGNIVLNPLAQRDRREMDAGHVSVGSDEAEERRTLPPNYSDVFQGSNAQV